MSPTGTANESRRVSEKFEDFRADRLVEVKARSASFEVAHLRQLLAQSGIFLVFLQARSASEWNSRRCATRSLACASGLYRLKSATLKQREHVYSAICSLAFRVLIVTQAFSK